MYVGARYTVTARPGCAVSPVSILVWYGGTAAVLPDGMGEYNPKRKGGEREGGWVWPKSLRAAGTPRVRSKDALDQSRPRTPDAATLDAWSEVVGDLRAGHDGL